MTSERSGFVKSSLRRTLRDRRVARIEIARAFFKLVILNRSAFGKMAAHFGDALALLHQLDFGEAKFFALR